MNHLVSQKKDDIQGKHDTHLGKYWWHRKQDKRCAIYLDEISKSVHICRTVPANAYTDKHKTVTVWLMETVYNTCEFAWYLIIVLKTRSSLETFQFYLEIRKFRFLLLLKIMFSALYWWFKAQKCIPIFFCVSRVTACLWLFNTLLMFRTNIAQQTWWSEG